MLTVSFHPVEHQLPRHQRMHSTEQASDMDGYGRSLDLMGIHGFKKRTAMVLMDGLEISQDDAGQTS